MINKEELERQSNSTVYPKATYIRINLCDAVKAERMDSFTNGHKSRDKEVDQLKTNLRKFIDMCSSPCVTDEFGFNNELNDLIQRSRLLLKGGGK